MARKTHVAIQGEDFLINGEPTYKGRQWQGTRIVEGPLYNTCMVRHLDDDMNPDTRTQVGLPEPAGNGTPERNTDEFIARLPEYKQHGVLSVTLCSSTAPLDGT